MRAISKSFFILISFIFIASSAFSQWQVDQKYGMKINIPSDWSKKSYQDGTDQVYEFYSADQTVAVQLRAFSADPSLTLELLIQVYEQAMIPAGANRLSLNDHTSVNGIPGKQGVYQLNQGGTIISLAAFYVIQKGNAYVLTAIIPNEVLEKKSVEVKSVTQSFQINGFEPTQQAQNTKVLPKPPGQNTGARPSNNSNSATAGNGQTGQRINMKSHQRLDFKTRKVGAKGDIWALSKCGPEPEFEGKIQVTNYTDFTSATQYNMQALQGMNFYDRTTVPLNKVCFVLLNDGSLAKMKVVQMDEYPEDCSYFATLEIEYPVGSSSTTSNANSNSIAGRYNFVSRSDGKVLTNYHYIVINNNGTYEEKYEPKNSPGYQGGNSGNWDSSQGTLYLRHSGGGVTDTYRIQGNELHRTTSSGLTFIFRKQ